MITVKRAGKWTQKRNDQNGSLVFAVPTYAWRIPKIVEQWIRDTESAGTARAWFVMNCGDEI